MREHLFIALDDRIATSQSAIKVVLGMLREVCPGSEVQRFGSIQEAEEYVESHLDELEHSDTFIYILTDMHLQPDDKGGDLFIKTLRFAPDGTPRLGIPVYIITKYSLHSMNTNPHKNSTFENDCGGEGTGFYRNCFYYHTTHVQKIAEAIRSSPYSLLPPDEIGEVYRQSAFYRKANIEQAHRLREEILMPLALLCNALQMYYGGVRGTLDLGDVDFEKELQESKEALEAILQLTNSRGETYPEKVFLGRFYEDDRLKALMEVLNRPGGAMEILNGRASEYERIVHLIIEQFPEDLEKIVQFVES